MSDIAKKKFAIVDVLKKKHWADIFDRSNAYFEKNKEKQFSIKHILYITSIP